MDYSIESLIAEGTGLKVKDTTFASTSTEAYDGYFDGVEAEVTRSFENLEFLDTYSKINAANADAKLRMMKRLKRVYGSTIEDQTKASSVESYIDNNIKSLEADDGKKTDQKKGFFARIIEGLKTMLENIRTFFQTVWQKIKEFFTKRKKENSRMKTAEEVANSVSGEIYVFDVKNLKTDNAVKFFKADVARDCDTIMRNVRGDHGRTNYATKDSLDSNFKAFLSKYGSNINQKDISHEEICAQYFGLKGKKVTVTKGKPQPEIVQFLKNVTEADVFAANKKIMDNVNKPSDEFLKKVDLAIKCLDNHIKQNNLGETDSLINKVATVIRNISSRGHKIMSSAVKLIQDTNKFLAPKNTKISKDQKAKNKAMRDAYAGKGQYLNTTNGLSSNDKNNTLGMGPGDSRREYMKDKLYDQAPYNKKAANQ